MTSYSLIFQKYMHEIHDFDLTSMTEEDMIIENTLTLSKAVSLFQQCKSNLSRDDNTLTFNSDLTEEEQWILADYMRKVWLDESINSGNLIKLNLSDKDFRIFSPADKLRELSKLKTQYDKELKLKINEYLYRGIDYSSFVR